eukprot:3451824-Prymnesium_polylepis.1
MLGAWCARHGYKGLCAGAVGIAAWAVLFPFARLPPVYEVDARGLWVPVHPVWRFSYGRWSDVMGLRYLECYFAGVLIAFLVHARAKQGRCLLSHPSPPHEYIMQHTPKR